MKVAVMGAGAVGGYFGGILAKSGVDVALIARGKHLQAMKEKGLFVKSYKGDFKAKVKTTSDPRAISPVDLILFTVKSYDTEEAIQLCFPMIRENTSVLSLQNGIDNDEKIAKAVGWEKVIGGVAYIGVSLEEPGVIRHSAVGKIAFGELDGRVTDRVKEIAEMFSKAEIPFEISGDIVKLKWKKLVWNAAFNALTTITGATVADVMNDAKLRDIAVDAMNEVVEVAQKSGVELDESVIDDALELSKNLGNFKTSMLQDFERGRKTEVEALNKVVVEKGRGVNVRAPINHCLYSMVSFLEKRR
ncbi:MAG: ketopantoate reductase family protein [Candidatus Hydrothermarchaeales archaeon]